MRQVIEAIIDSLALGKAVVLCTIVHNSEPSPRKLGTHMVIHDDGTAIGSVGGGSLEYRCQAEAKELFHGATKFTAFDFQPIAAPTSQNGMACGGGVTVLLERISPPLLPLMKQVRDECLACRQAMLLTMLPVNGEAPQRLLLLPQKENGGVPEELRAEIERRSHPVPFLLDHQGRRVLVEPLLHHGTIHLAGAGHIAMAVAKLAAFVGFEVVVIDDRPTFVNRTRFPDAREVREVTSFATCLGPLGQDDYVVIATRSHQVDRNVLAQALRSQAGYIGMIGSQRKRAAIYELLRQEGVSDLDLARVRCPIGLAIDAETPEEIAISVVAELVQTRARKTRPPSTRNANAIPTLPTP